MKMEDCFDCLELLTTLHHCSLFNFNFILKLFINCVSLHYKNKNDLGELKLLELFQGNLCLRC